MGGRAGQPDTTNTTHTDAAAWTTRQNSARRHHTIPKKTLQHKTMHDDITHDQTQHTTARQSRALHDPRGKENKQKKKNRGRAGRKHRGLGHPRREETEKRRQGGRKREREDGGGSLKAPGPRAPRAGKTKRWTQGGARKQQTHAQQGRTQPGEAGNLCAPRSDAPHTQHSTPSVHRGEQELSGRGNRTRNKTRRTYALVSRSQVAKNTTHTGQHIKHTHRWRGASRLRTLHTQRNTRSGHTSEQEPSGPGQRPHSTTCQTCTPVNRSQVAQDTTHTAQHTGWAHRGTRAKWPRTPHTQHNTPSVHTVEQDPSGLGHHTHSTTYRACTPVKRSEWAKDTAHAMQQAKRIHR